MKYCEDWAALLDPFVDGELPPEEMERVRAHLETCPGCRAYVDDALAMRAGFPDVEDTAVPEGFAEGVMERIRGEEEKREKIVELPGRSTRRWIKTLAGLAACCALVILVRTTGSVRSDSATMAAADTSGETETVVTFTAGPSTEPGAPAGEAGENEESAATSRMVPAETSSSMSAEEQKIENGAAAGKAGAFDYDQTAGGTVGGERGTFSQTENSAEDATESGKVSEAAGTPAALVLTGEEAGELLDGFAPVWEDAVSACYQLDAGEYRTLLEALGRPAEIQGTEEGTFPVVVRWASE